MRFADFQIELASRLKLDLDANKVTFQRKINDAYKEIARAYDWEHLRRTGEITSIPNYTTGTVSVANGSYIATGSGTSWTSSMEGRYFKVTGSNWYRISKVQSATQLTLLSPYLDSTLSNQTYIIWKRFYYLYSEVHRIIDFASWIRNGELVDRPSQYLSDISPDISTAGEPESFSLYGADPFERSYTDSGTVSLSNNSNLLSGVGTTFLGNAEPGDIVTVGSAYFRVKRVESDTTIRLTNAAIADVSTSTYTISKDNPIGIQLYFAANSSYLFPFTYAKRVYDMLNDNDRPELPEDFDMAILDGAEAARYRELNDTRWVNKLQEYVLRVKDLMSQRLLSKPRARIMAPKIYTRGGYING